jgi:putative glutathione S-transferase
MLNTCFDDFLEPEYQGVTYFPQEDAKLVKEIEDFNSWVYPNINNGVYKTGFASKQDAHEEAVKPLFEVSQ